MKAFISSLGLVAVLGIATACTARSGQVSSDAHAPVKADAPAKAAPRAPLTVRVLAPSRIVKAGAALRATIIVENDTGHAIHTSGCGALFALAFVSRTYHPTVAWPDCLQRLTIAKGTTRSAVSLPATYSQCGQVASDASPACLPHNKMPPLPAGAYRIVLEQVRHLVRAPAPIPVHVTPVR